MACGTGALAVDFAKSGYDVTALDLSEEMLMIAVNGPLKKKCQFNLFRKYARFI